MFFNMKAVDSQGTPPVSPQTEGDGNESERERLLRTWRLHPTALVDLCSNEEIGGPADGAGIVTLCAPDGAEIAEFHFHDVAEADAAVDYALRAMNPGQ